MKRAFVTGSIGLIGSEAVIFLDRLGRWRPSSVTRSLDDIFRGLVGH